MTTLHRVMLIEDDAALRRFVEMALEDLPIELVQCETVAAALALLARGSFTLILSDLMMPGESGFDLLERLQREPALRGSARVAVLSAGLTATVRDQLADMDVWRLLSKPVSVGTLVNCVQDAIDGGAVAADPGDQAMPAQDGDKAHAVKEYFDGNQELFDAYHEACMDQFQIDMHEGDKACIASDLPTLRLITHSLKSVLLTLGYPVLASQARALEDACHAGTAASAQGQWRALRDALGRILQER